MIFKKLGTRSGSILTDIGRIVCGTKDEFWSAVVPGADVADVGFPCNEDFGTTKVTQLENTGLWVQEQVLGFNVTMANADRMNVRERAEKLIHVKLDLKNRHWLFKLNIVSARAIDSLRDKLEDEVQVHFILLLVRNQSESLRIKYKEKITHLFTIRIKE